MKLKAAGGKPSEWVVVSAALARGSQGTATALISPLVISPAAASVLTAFIQPHSIQAPPPPYDSVYHSCLSCDVIVLKIHGFACN